MHQFLTFSIVLKGTDYMSCPFFITYILKYKNKYKNICIYINKFCTFVKY